MATINELHIQNTRKKRDAYWDNIKGVLIILVVFAHCLYDLRDSHLNAVIVESIYYFHMPAFIFVSGYFSKSENSHSKKSILFLLVAYFIFITPFVVRAMILWNEPKIIKPYYSAWYLLVLMICRLITPHLAKCKYIFPASVLFTILVGYWNDFSTTASLGIRKLVVFYPFFVAGYLLSGDTVEKIFRRKTALTRLLSGGVLLVLAGMCELYTHKWLHITLNDLLPGVYKAFNIEEALIRMSIMIVSCLVITALLMLSPEMRIPFLTTTGKNTLSIFIMHGLFTLLFSKSSYVSAMPVYTQILLAAALTLLIILLFGNDLFSGKFNLLIRRCAEGMLEHEGTNRELIAYKIFIYVLIGFLFVMPIIVKAVRL